MSPVCRTVRVSRVSRRRAPRPRRRRLSASSTRSQWPTARRARRRTAAHRRRSHPLQAGDRHASRSSRTVPQSRQHLTHTRWPHLRHRSACPRRSDRARAACHSGRGPGRAGVAPAASGSPWLAHVLHTSRALACASHAASRAAACSSSSSARSARQILVRSSSRSGEVRVGGAPGFWAVTVMGHETSPPSAGAETAAAVPSARDSPPRPPSASVPYPIPGPTVASTGCHRLAGPNRPTRRTGPRRGDLGSGAGS